MMTESKHTTRAGPSHASHGGNVLDPEWEQALRRGQEAEGEAGSVDAELAFVHLLRHTREPEAISAEQLDAIWSDIQAEVAPAGEPWWRKAWVWWSAPALAAAAVLFVVVVDPTSDESNAVALQDSAPHADERVDQAAERPAPAATPSEGSADDAVAELEKADAEASGADKPTAARGASSDNQVAARDGHSGGFETSFARLAPHGRAAISVSVDQSRDELRSRLLAKSRGGG
jgi:hypothetical protein